MNNVLKRVLSLTLLICFLTGAFFLAQRRQDEGVDLASILEEELQEIDDRPVAAAEIHQERHVLSAWEEADEAPLTYLVQEGDVLSLIAQRFDLCVERLTLWNELENPDEIFAGQLLHLVPQD